MGSVSPQTLYAYFIFISTLGKIWEEESRVRVVRGGQHLWDSKKGRQLLQAKVFPPPLQPVRSSCHRPPSLFSKICPDCFSPHQSSHSVSSFSKRPSVSPLFPLCGNHLLVLSAQKSIPLVLITESLFPLRNRAF